MFCRTGTHCDSLSLLVGDNHGKCKEISIYEGLTSINLISGKMFINEFSIIGQLLCSADQIRILASCGKRLSLGKWEVSRAIESAQQSLQLKEVMGFTQSNK